MIRKTRQDELQKHCIFNRTSSVRSRFCGVLGAAAVRVGEICGKAAANPHRSPYAPPLNPSLKGGGLLAGDNRLPAAMLQSLQLDRGRFVSVYALERLCGPFQQIESAVGPNIGRPGSVDGAAPDDRAFLHHVEPNALHQFVKIPHGHKVHVGSFMPFVREAIRNRRAAAEQNFPAHTPVPKIWYHDQTTVGDSQHFLQQLLRVLHLLQRLDGISFRP